MSPKRFRLTKEEKEHILDLRENPWKYHSALLHSRLIEVLLSLKEDERLCEYSVCMMGDNRIECELSIKYYNKENYSFGYRDLVLSVKEV